MEEEKHLALFNGKAIRKTWFAERWWFVIEDIISVLTESTDPKQYIQRIKQRDEILAEGWVQIVHTLPILTSGGKQEMNCSDTEGIFRIIQSIPSKRAEPFKKWLAKVGYERVQEIENPELAQDRMKDLYEKKGYPKDWIDKRLRGIAIRQNLTDEWKERGVIEQKDFAILTAEISKATFGLTPSEYKAHKNLDLKSNINLRDHMDDLELIFTMLGERVTTEITQQEKPETFGKIKTVANRGGKVAGVARKKAEEELGRSVVTKENYLDKNKELCEE